MGSRVRAQIEICFETSRWALQAATEWVTVKVKIAPIKDTKVHRGNKGIALPLL
jgi:hypothetical protein